MKSERIGNDIKIEWSILRQGVPFSLTDKDVTIYLGSPFGRTKISAFATDSNKIIWTFFGKDQKSLGKYSLILVVNEGNEGMITTDICDFVNLVRCSCEVGGVDDANVQTETISLTSNLEYVATDAYDDAAVWEYINKLEKNKADKTEIPTKVSQLENDADYATRGDIDGKQDEIEDLDAIRSGAAKGATALQSIPAEFINESELSNALSPYARKNDIATINGKSIVNGGNIEISGGGGSGYDDTEIRAELDELSAEIKEVSDNKQDKISDLDTIRSGASKGATAIQEVKTINGQSIVGSGNIAIEGGSGGGINTPSGDPMHYMFELAGATYNATDADIPMTGIYGDSYVHKAKHWHLNELGDLTTEEIREIYASRYSCTALTNLAQRYFSSYPFRTNMADARISTSGIGLQSLFSSCKCKTAIINSKVYSLGITTFTSVFIYANSIEKILNELNVSSASVGDSFRYCYNLKEVRIKGLKAELNIKDSGLLSNASILYMIQNEAATAAITITLHADAYDRAMADAEITAALAAHPNVSLAKA